MLITYAQCRASEQGLLSGNLGGMKCPAKATGLFEIRASAIGSRKMVHPGAFKG